MGKEKNPSKTALERKMQRREFDRIDFPSTPWVFALALPENLLDGKPLRLEAKNISLGGVKFQTNKKIPLFSVLSMQFFDRAGKATPLDFAAKVIRVEEVDEGREEKTYGIAAQFENVGDAEQARLIEVLGEDED
jgi:c-di-GMP-binding flagellar brake protein YcgR